jgi:hypothetical protein
MPIFFLVKCGVLIVSGLQPTPSRTDKSLFTDLCSAEFKFQPDIISLKRIGHPQPDKIQPLLVTLRNVDQAQRLISDARQLRKSTNAAVRNSIFINPNLTRAEAEAAYQARMHRRQVARERSDRQRQGSSDEHVSEQLIVSENDNGAATVSDQQGRPQC